MGEVVNMGTRARPRRSYRTEVPEGGAIVLLFTAVQFVRDGSYQALSASLASGDPDASVCVRDAVSYARQRVGAPPGYDN